MGLDTAALEPMYAELQQTVTTGAIPGIVTLIAQGDDTDLRSFGTVSLNSDTPLKDDALFRIQSMTKPLTAVATLQLVEKGMLSLDAPVDRWLPELSDRRVLRRPDSALDDTIPAERSITVHDLLSLQAGYGMILADPHESPIHQAMIDAGVEPGPAPHMVSSDEWLARFRDLPLIAQPGEAWRYHIPYDMLGVLIARVSDHPYREYLRRYILNPLDMTETDMWAVDPQRLPAAYTVDAAGELQEFQPVAGGAWASDPGFDISHWELVSTARDYHRFARMLLNGGELDGARIVSESSVQRMVDDQVPDQLKTEDSFFPGFWNENTWGYGTGVTATGPQAGRYGWSGGLGTDWQTDPKIGVIALFLTQVEMGPRFFAAIRPFQAAIDAMRAR